MTGEPHSLEVDLNFETEGHQVGPAQDLIGGQLDLVEAEEEAHSIGLGMGLVEDQLDLTTALLGQHCFPTKPVANVALRAS